VPETSSLIPTVRRVRAEAEPSSWKRPATIAGVNSLEERP
jgi:hypothetical protein